MAPIRGLGYVDWYGYGGLLCVGRYGGERDLECECLGPSVEPVVMGKEIGMVETEEGKLCTLAGGVGAVIVAFECVC